MSITVAEIFERTSTILQDVDAARWTEPELLDWYNEGLLDMVTRRPGLLVSVGELFTCVAGTVQAVPANRIRLIDVGRCLATGGVPQVMNKNLFDRLHPAWQSDTATAVVTVVATVDSIVDKFFVYPPQPSSGQAQLELTFSKRPVVVSDKDTGYELPDESAPIMIEYLLSRCFKKDADSPNAARLASQYLNNYLGMLGNGVTKAAA